MKLTKLTLQQIIREELENIDEGAWDWLKSKSGKKEPELSAADLRAQRRSGYTRGGPETGGGDNLAHDASLYWGIDAESLGWPRDAISDKDFKAVLKPHRTVNSMNNILLHKWLCGQLPSQREPPADAVVKKAQTNLVLGGKTVEARAFNKALEWTSKTCRNPEKIKQAAKARAQNIGTRHQEKRAGSTAGDSLSENLKKK